MTDDMIELCRQGRDFAGLCRERGLPYATTYWQLRRGGWSGVGRAGRKAHFTLTGKPAAAWIVAWVAARHNLTVDDLTDKGRSAPVVHVRRIACVLLAHAGYSTPVIARTLGRKDHTTVLHHLDVAAKRLGRDTGYAKHIRTLKAQLDALSEEA